MRLQIVTLTSIATPLVSPGKDGHVALRQSGWTTSRNWQDVEVGDFVVVKCTKESYGSKGPKVSAVLSHPGRFVVSRLQIFFRSLGGL